LDARTLDSVASRRVAGGSSSAAGGAGLPRGPRGGVGRDITPLRAAEVELRKLNAALEERVAACTLHLDRANADLRSFAWTVSHDLRAPLRAMRGYLALLAEDEGERLSEDGRAMLHRGLGWCRKGPSTIWMARRSTA